LLDWVATDRSLTARTGQTFKLTPRNAATTAGGYDSNGAVLGNVNHEPRWGYRNGQFGLWCNRALTNLVVQSDGITTGNGWTLAGTGASAAAYATHANIPFTRVTSISGTTELYRTVTLTGNGVKTYAIAVRADDGVSGTVLVGLYDATALAWRAKATVTVAADGTIAFSNYTGTLQGVENLGDGVYRVLIQTTSCTAANTHRCYAANGSGGTATSIRVSRAQVDDNPICGPMVPTAGTTVTSTADSYSCLVADSNALAIPPFTSLPLYTKAVHFATLVAATNWELVSCDDNTSATWHTRIDGAAGYPTAQYGYGGNYVSPSSAHVAAYGDVMEVCGQFYKKGVSPYAYARCYSRQNGGATSDSGEAGGSPAVWQMTGIKNMYLLSHTSLGQSGAGLLQAVRIALGAQSIDYMSAGL